MILAILQARVSSTRLPGKVLKPILGRPMLWRQLERVLRVRNIDKLVVATSDRPEDRDVGALCEAFDVECFFGSLDDVLDRFYQAAKRYNPVHVVRLTGDCPLSDPEVIERIIEFHLEGEYDYTSNTIEPTFPDGLCAEIMQYSCLQQAWQEARLPSEREHVTPFIIKRPERFKLGNFKGEEDLSALRWTVDEPEDFVLVTRIYEALYPQNPQFTMRDILDFLDKNPELIAINSAFERNEGYRKSLEQDPVGV
ncbi:MAG: cytidylyltransferase domain-containing protein [Candidatus Zixiibacteriota bacterium]